MRSWIAPVVVLAAGSFAMGTDSFVVAGVLPEIAGDLRVSQASAGQVVTVFALTYALAAPLLAAVTGRWARRPLLAAALGVFVVANGLAAAAPSLTALLLARVLAALAAALFTPSASAAAATLAGPERRGRALSIILGGLAVGTVFGVPAGTAIGQAWGWPASLLFVAAVALGALIALLATLPALPAPPLVGVRARLAVLADLRVLAIVAVTTVATAAGILVYTYIATVVRGVSLPVALLAWGIGGSAGAFGSGWATDRFGAGRTVVGAVAALAVSLLGLSVASGAAALGLMVLYGAAAWAVATPNNHRLTGLAPAFAGVVISFNSSGIYLGQALGAAAGGVLLGRADLCLVGAAVALGALTLQLAVARPTALRRASDAPTPA